MKRIDVDTMSAHLRAIADATRRGEHTSLIVIAATADGAIGEVWTEPGESEQQAADLLHAMAEDLPPPWDKRGDK